MKKINTFKISFTFAGCFLGAGYVSGQELFQFFGSFGVKGVYGIVCAVLLQVVFGIMLLRMAMNTGTAELDRIVMPNDKGFVRNILAALQSIFLFGVAVIMIAGAGALAQQLFSVPSFVGSVVFCVLIALVAIVGVGGMITVFSLFVPLLSVMTAVIAVVALSRNGFGGFNCIYIENTSNPLISNFAVSAITFVSYNIFSSIGILTPVGKDVKNEKSISIGVSLGGVLLMIIAGAILIVMNIYSASVKTELPMLYAAGEIGVVFSYIYAFLLFGGMFGSSLSSIVALITFFEMKKPEMKKKRVITVVVMSVLALMASLFGFGNLIGTVYPVFGYLGITALVLIAINYFKTKSNRKMKAKH